MSNAATLTARHFGRCPATGCKTRRVIEVGVTEGIEVHGARQVGYSDAQGFIPLAWTNSARQRAASAAHGLSCTEHGMPLRFTSLAGTYNAEKECNGRCMGSTGPACDCACGGENHGRNHVS